MRGLSLRDSLFIRLLVITLCILLLLAPTGEIESLIGERQSRKDQALEEVSSKWGGDQALDGPILTIPYRHHFLDEKKNDKWTIQHAHFLPADLEIDAQVAPEVRHRGLYEFVVYTATLTVKGRFSAIDPMSLNIPPDDVIWKDAALTVGIQDTVGIRAVEGIRWDESSPAARPGLPATDVIPSGFQIPVAASGGKSGHTFSFTLRLNGSESLMVAPLGEKSTLRLAAPWHTPSFQGAFLPVEHQILPDRFTARWEVLDLNRNYPQSWQGSKHTLSPSHFGVTLLQPVETYQKITRTTKYALLIIVLTFASFFLIEVLGRRRIHPIQYLLVGFALLMFYTLLLALSEHISFGLSYGLAAAAVVLLIGGYAWGVLKDRVLSGGVASLLAVTHLFLYVILQLESYALLLGSVALFATLAVFMYLTRDINWFEISRESSRPGPGPGEGGDSPSGGL